MKHAITLFIIFVLILSAKESISQKKLNYKDVYEVVKGPDKDKSYSLLLAYQKQDPEFANTYFQLGLIAHDWALKFNPFTEFKLTKLFIYNTKLYYNLAASKLIEEKKKNKDYYLNAISPEVDSKLQMEDINAFIKEKEKEITKYEKNIIQIIDWFNLSSDHYNECVNIFMDINKAFTKIKHIYLTETPEFNENLLKLEQHFDSTIYYFKKYKTALNNYPVKGYDQQYELKDIITYRLDGLTFSNFLNNNITLWNYKKWAEEVRRIKKESVTSNRNELIETDQSMKSLMSSVENGAYTEKYSPYSVDKKLIYKIEKFDNNSSTVQLIKLNAAYINFLKFFKQSINNPANDSTRTYNKFLQFVDDFVEMKETCDSLNNDFILSINDAEINKYPEFYNKQYRGKSGLISYSENLKGKLNKKLSEVLKILKITLMQEQCFPEEKTVKYRSIITKYKTGVPQKENISSNSYYIRKFKKSNSDVITVSGYYKTSSGNLAGFAGQTKDTENYTSFVKSAVSDTADVLFSVVEPTDDGFYVIQTTKGNIISNTLIKYLYSGKEKFRKNLPYNEYPRFMRYDDINNIMQIVFSGNAIDPEKEKTGMQTILFLSLNENEDSPVLRLEGQLSVFDILKLNENYLIFNNFTSFKDIDGTFKNADAGSGADQTNVLVSITNTEGHIIKHVPIRKEQSFFGTDAVKINSDLINILGFSSSFKEYQLKELKDKPLLFLMINSDIESVYSAWHD